MIRSGHWLLVALPLCGMAAIACSTSSTPPADEEKPSAWKQTNASLHERLATAALNGGRLEAAAAEAREALRIDPKRATAAMILAQALVQSGKEREAEVAARRAIELEPDNAEAYLLCAEALFAQNRRDDARAHYERAVELGSAEASLLLGIQALADGDDARAIAHLARSDEQGDIDGAEVLASHLLLTGRAGEAEEVLMDAHDRSPTNRALQLQLDEVRYANGQDQAIVDRLDRERQRGLAPNAELRFLAAASLMRSGQVERAADEYRDLALHLPEQPEVRVALGEALLEQGDLEGAEAAFEEAVRLDDRSRTGLVGLARVELARQDPRGAVETLERALLVDPKHVATRSLLVMACAEVPDPARARREADAVRRLSPGSDLDLACRRILQKLPGAEADSEQGRP